MKKLFSLVLFVAFASASHAQAVSFLLTYAPCHNDGVLQASFTGLTPPLTVTWQTAGTTGTTIIHTGVSGLSDDLTGYSGGEINLSAVDAHGLTAAGAYAGHPPFTICPFALAPGLCPARDTLTASICSGGTPPFTYQWYDVTSTGIIGTSNPITVLPGSYGVNVTDHAGCTFGSTVSNISAFAFDIPAFADSFITTIANCTDGSALVTPYAGGTAPFGYQWSNGATSAYLDGLVMGHYSVTITDANGCHVTDATDILQAVTLIAPVSPTSASCAASNGAVTASAIGGTPPYAYVWSNGFTGASQTGLTAGFYGVNITDANGCIGSGGGTVGASTPISVDYVATPSLCTSPTGNATLGITGGTGLYSVTWYTTPAQTGITAHSLINGTYVYNVTDASGCSTTGAVTVPPIDIISVSFSTTPASCTLSDGSITAYPTGGVAPYSYSWSTGATSAGLTSQPSGDYGVNITDHVGCKVSAAQNLPLVSPLGVAIYNTQASCLFTNDGMDNAVASGGVPPYSYAWSSGGTSASISALPFGPYWLTVTDASGCTSANNYSYVGADPAGTDCYCTISGTIYNDFNINCIQDPGEAGIPNVQVSINGLYYTYTDANGFYSFKVPSGTYVVTETVQPEYPLSACQIGDVVVPVSASTGCSHTVNFANNIVTAHDMHISTWDYNMAAPGHTYKQVMIVSNDGTVEEDSTLVSYNPDGQVFQPSFTPGGVFSGAANNYNTAGTFPVMTPGMAQQFFASYNVPANIPAGTNLLFTDTVSYKSPIAFWQLDLTPSNNINTVTTTVAGPSAANFKQVIPKGAGVAGVISYSDSVLEYMIHFQNTYPASAENIVIVDTLDDNLNWLSLKPVFESAPCQVTLVQTGTKKLAKFTFSNINLPAQANDDERSNGMVTYTIRLNPGLASGTQIRNHSSIYYDYNAPVITNTTLNTIGATAPPEGVATVAAQQGSFTIYPNPASQSFSAIINSSAATTASMVVSDLTGKTLMTKTIALQQGAQTVATDISQLTPGVYFVTLNENGKTQTQKLVIMK